MRGREHAFHEHFDRGLMPMLLVDTDQRCTRANPAACLYLRMRPVDIVNRPLGDITGPDHRGSVATERSRFPDGETWSGRRELLLGDGGRAQIDVGAHANVLPGLHLVLFLPADWEEEPWGAAEAAETLPDGLALDVLSAREREVLTLVAAGVTLSDIAEQLILSPHTVRTHLRNVRGKLGARNRAHAIAVAVRAGII